MARVLVIGGTGVISGPCVAALVAAGHDVTTLRRGTARPAALAPGVQTIAGDRNDTGALAHALRTAAPEVVIDFACFSTDQADALVAALPPACRQLILVSTVDVYGLPLPVLPMPELPPWAPPGSAYAGAKRQIEERLTRALASTGTALTIARPTYSFGAGFLISLFDRAAGEVVGRMRLGLPVLLPDGGGRRLHPSDARDTGRMIARLADAGVAFGRDFTVGTPGAATTHKGYLEAIAAALGVRPVFHETTGDDLAQPGVLDPGSLWFELTCRDLAYDLSGFLTDFPAFRPTGTPGQAMAAHAALLDPAGDHIRAIGPEARAIASLTAAGQPPAAPRR